MKIKINLIVYRDWALEQVMALRKLSLGAFGGPVRTETKKDGSPVTALDRECEKLFRQSVAKHFPKHGVLGEEYGEKSGESPWMWVIDPIDGTRAFSRGLPTWGSLLSLLYNGEPVMAVADYPAVGTTLWSIKGKGAWEGVPNGKIQALKLRVSNTRAVKEAVVLHSGSNFFTDTDLAPAVQGILKECYLERGYGDCYAYWQLLKGSADLVLDFGVKIWDLAPFLLMLEEARGQLRDFKGRRRWEGPAAVSGNSTLVSEFVSRLRGVPKSVKRSRR